jgi:alpha/beta superfamily hydrolase
MNAQTVRQMLAGPAGSLEVAIDQPAGEPRGIAVICHPNPQQGGTMDNKVVQTLARAALQLGLRSVRFNYRGVGRSEGAWDDGRGEVDDAMAVIEVHRDPTLPLLLAGFSFGAFVISQANARLADDQKPQRLVLVGPSTQRQQLAAVPAETIVIHGEVDEVVPLAATLEWARPLALPVIVFPGVGHFFHGQLALLRRVVVQQLAPLPGDPAKS